jgi:hypothetical protein
VGRHLELSEPERRALRNALVEGEKKNSLDEKNSNVK